jgi:formylglycine-generating enzyme required for sulfatase activity
MMLVCVPAGNLTIGAAEDDTQAGADEKPLHQVYLDAFWIDRTEVTNAMFEKCIAANACHKRDYSPYLLGVRLPNGTSYYGEADYADYPVIILDSEEVQTYCEWAERRLPFEAEWEKAARGTDSKLYPRGNILDCRHANYLGCDKKPAKVTALELGASPFGVLNMSGNLWEWVVNWYDSDYYSQSPEKNPNGPTLGEYRTLRGGGWRSLEAQLRLTNRSTGKPEHSTDGEIGVRCV